MLPADASHACGLTKASALAQSAHCPLVKPPSPGTVPVTVECCRRHDRPGWKGGGASSSMSRTYCHWYYRAPPLAGAETKTVQPPHSQRVDPASKAAVAQVPFSRPGARTPAPRPSGPPAQPCRPNLRHGAHPAARPCASATTSWQPPPHRALQEGRGGVPV